ncbi:alpha/beta hydrolase [Streptosporangium sp. NPDC051022]|uniref:alpha/beta fold hydrolase n=1 Tax=Streptosporangium sp. NPDC051022 TaxID=3155752 RepID=UPI0034249BF5
MSEPESQWFESSGGTIHYRIAGDGPRSMVMIHGGGPGAEGMSNYRDVLPHFIDRYRVVVPDMPQWGNSDKRPIRGNRFEHNARVFGELLDHLGMRDADIIGNSMGGSTAIRLAHDRPELVRRVVAMGSTCGYSMPPTKELWPPAGLRAMHGYYRDPSLDAMTELLQMFFYDPSNLSPDLIKRRYDASIEPGHLEALRDAKANGTVNEDLSGLMPSIEKPVLLLWAMNDQFSSLEYGLLFARLLPQSRLIMLPRCGHWAHVERPEEFTRITAAFLEEGDIESASLTVRG